MYEQSANNVFQLVKTYRSRPIVLHSHRSPLVVTVIRLLVIKNIG